MAITSIPASPLRDAMTISGLYDHINKTCLVLIDRSMWFAKSYEALADNNFQFLVRKHQHLAGQEDNFREPVVFAFN